MIRRFRQHDIRPVVDLSGVWDFTYLGEMQPEHVDITALTFPDRMAVPGCFDSTPAFAGKRGLAAYRTQLFLPEAGRYRLVFYGVNHWCSVWVGEQKLAEHSSGFTRFSLDFTSSDAKTIPLVVLVDNRFDPERAPLHSDFFDWYHYGGIARPVTLEHLGSAWIESVQVVTDDYAERRLSITVNYAAQVTPQWSELSLAFNDQVVLAEKVHLETPTGAFTREFQFPQAALWSPQDPHLHFVHARLGEDDLRERIGIRQVQAAGQDLLINGQPVRLLGFNRHEAHPEFGCALPESLMLSDVQQLCDLGCNFVRGSHYPQDERFLDLCDETGLCVWNEVTGWQNTADQLVDPRFLAAQKLNAAEMVAMSGNHPAVILYGLLNESHSNDLACRPAYESIIQTLRQLDPTRLITYASHHILEDVCLDLVDVISINSYPGWYEGSIEEIPARIASLITHIDSGELRDKPVLLSEIGAEGIYGWRDWNEARWTEQYQARLLETVIRHIFVDRHRIAGLSIWLFADFRSSEAVPRVLGRGRGFNNKGVVDEYRRPKQAYFTVREAFRALNPPFQAKPV